VLQQQADHLHVTLRGRPHQGRLSPPALARIDLRAVPEQHLCRIDAPGARYGHQRCLPFRVGGFRVRPGAQQQRECRGVAHFGGGGHRCRAEAVGRARVRAGAQQRTHQFRVAAVRGQVQGGGAVGIGGAGIGAAGKGRDRLLAQALAEQLHDASARHGASAVGHGTAGNRGEPQGDPQRNHAAMMPVGCGLRRG
jgi:hypothetical protein